MVASTGSSVLSGDVHGYGELMANDDHERTSRSLNLTTGGITLLGVLLSIGVTVGTAVQDRWWVRVLAGICTTVVLTAIVKLGSDAGRGPLARLADWVIGGDRRQE